MTSKDNKKSIYTEEVTMTKKATSATSSMVMNLSGQSNRELGRQSKAKSSDDDDNDNDVIRRFSEDRDHVIDRLYRGSGDNRNAAASAEAHNAGVREKTEEYAKVIEQKACQM